METFLPLLFWKFLLIIKRLKSAIFVGENDSGQMKIVNYANMAICIVKYSFNYLLILINWNFSSQLMYTIECLFYTIFGVLMLEKRGLCVDKTKVMFKSARFFSHVIATFWQITGINPLFKWSQDKQVHYTREIFIFSLWRLTYSQPCMWGLSFFFHSDFKYNLITLPNISKFRLRIKI